MNQIIPLLLIFLCISVPVYCLFIAPQLKKRVLSRVWERIEDEIILKNNADFKISISEKNRVVEASERIIVKDMAYKSNIPITLVTLEARKRFPIRFKIEYGGDEKWAPKQSSQLPHIFHKGPLHFWSDRNLDWKKFIGKFEPQLLNIAKNNSRSGGYSIDIDKNKISFKEDYLINDEKRILKIVDVLKTLLLNNIFF